MPSLTVGDEIAQAEIDFRERLASLKRCIPHMVDNGGIWPRDVEWLIAELEKARKDSARLDALDARCEAIGNFDMTEHVANGWSIDGPYTTLRNALDALMAVSTPE